MYLYSDERSLVRMLAASALASNTMIRSAVGSVFPLFTVQMFHKLGIQWASTLIALVCLVMMPIPFLFFKYGARIRQNSKFAPCLVCGVFSMFALAALLPRNYYRI